MQNKQLQERMATLKDDPEFAGMFEDIQKNGMGALMKYWDDPKVLAKLSEKLADVVPAGAAGAAAAAPVRAFRLLQTSRPHVQVCSAAQLFDISRPYPRCSFLPRLYV